MAIGDGEEKLKTHFPLDKNQPTPTYQEKFYSYKGKAVLAQCIATCIVSLTHFGVGILITMPTIVSGNLLNSTSDRPSLNEEEVSWFGSIPFLLQPVGVVLGILMQDYLSQRYGLWISNLLAVATFVTLYNARTTWTVLLSSFFMALSLGFTEPSSMGYISEYSETRLRGFMCSSALAMMSIGTLFEFVLLIGVHWRTAVLISATIPALSLLLLPWIPDSPVWLLSKGKRKKARRALVWFRGWITENDVHEEFSDLDTYVKSSLIHSHIIPNLGKKGLSELISSVLERRTLYPLFLLSIFQMTVLCAASAGARMYALNLFESLKIPIDRDWLMLPMNIASAIGHLIVIPMLKFTGKRKLSIVATFLTALMSICLGVYVYYRNQLHPWLFILLLLILGFESPQCGMIPWLMMGEIFPVRTRHAGSGLAGAMFDVSLFLVLKTYFTMDRFFGTPMMFVVNGLIGMIGCLYLYLYLPETDGKSLAEIEEIFSKKTNLNAPNDTGITK